MVIFLEQITEHLHWRLDVIMITACVIRFMPRRVIFQQSFMNFWNVEFYCCFEKWFLLKINFRQEVSDYMPIVAEVNYFCESLSDRDLNFVCKLAEYSLQICIYLHMLSCWFVNWRKPQYTTYWCFYDGWLKWLINFRLLTCFRKLDVFRCVGRIHVNGFYKEHAEFVLSTDSMCS